RRGHAAVAGEDDDRGARRGAAARRQDVDPGAVGELQVGQDQVPGALAGAADAFRGVGGGGDLVPLLAERALEHAAEGVAVLDDQDAAGGHECRPAGREPPAWTLAAARPYNGSGLETPGSTALVRSAGGAEASGVSRSS